MTSEDFKAFLSKQTQVKTQEDTIDWEAEKKQWIEQATRFVNEVKECLSEFPEILVNVENLNITEDKLGTYQAPMLVIELPKETVKLEPIGTILIGAYGRFDMKGLAGTVKWVLVAEDAERPVIKFVVNDNEKEQSAARNESNNLVWKLATPAPNIRYLPFSKEILLEAIMEVSHG